MAVRIIILKLLNYWQWCVSEKHAVESQVEPCAFCQFQSLKWPTILFGHSSEFFDIKRSSVAPSAILLKAKTFLASIEFTLRNHNGPVLLFKTIFRHRNCFLSSVATDGQDEHGLKLEKGGPTLKSFNVMPAKITIMKFFISFSTVAHRGHGTYIFISRDIKTVYRAINWKLSRDKSKL